MQPPLSEEAKKVLRALSERACDGFTLRARTGLGMDQLETAVHSLMDMGVVAVQGDANGEQFGRAYFWVPPDLQGKADYLLGKFAL